MRVRQVGTGRKNRMATTQIKGKTEQRVERVIEVLQSAPSSVGYEELVEKTGASYDSLLYILATLEEIGKVTRTTTATGPGRPKVFFEWVMM